MRLYIKRLKIHSLIGTHSWEQTQKQNLYLNISCDLDATKVASQDRIEDTLDYQHLADEISKLLEKSHFQLIESVARYVAEYLQNTHAIPHGSVEVIKPQALAEADSVGVVLNW